MAEYTESDKSDDSDELTALREALFSAVEWRVLLIEWHRQQVNKLKLITEHRDAALVFDDFSIEPGTDLHRGVGIGVTLALCMLGGLPLDVTDEDDGNAGE
jgi:hypothetical protein